MTSANPVTWADLQFPAPVHPSCLHTPGNGKHDWEEKGWVGKVLSTAEIQAWSKGKTLGWVPWGGLRVTAVGELNPPGCTLLSLKEQLLQVGHRDLVLDTSVCV